MHFTKNLSTAPAPNFLALGLIVFKYDRTVILSRKAI